MKHLKYLSVFVAAALMLAACNKQEGEQPADTVSGPTQEESTDNIYQFKVLDGHGDSVSLEAYRGQVILVVNTATQCGYTPQYTQLEQWYQAYREQGFVILDFPCNQFGGQAPGSYDDIHDFCTGTYNITFPQFAKIDVNGQNESPLYTWLKSKRPGAIQWNFTKFLVNREGEVVNRFSSSFSMTKVEEAIVAEL